MHDKCPSYRMCLVIIIILVYCYFKLLLVISERPEGKAIAEDSLYRKIKGKETTNTHKNFLSFIAPKFHPKKNSLLM